MRSTPTTSWCACRARGRRSLCWIYDGKAGPSFSLGMTNIRKIRLGVVGLGRAFTLMLPTFVADERVELVGAADPRIEARRRFESDFAARAYESIEPQCGDSSIEAIYVASPHQLHAEHVRLAAAAG